MDIVALFNGNDPIWEVLIRFMFHILVLFIVVRLIYNRYSDKKGNMFSFFLMGVVIFLVCGVLKGVDLNIGMAFGLFALFSIVRYRTKNIPIKEMSYFFTIMGLAAINALIEFPHPVRGLILINTIIVLTVFVLEIAFKKNAKPEKIESKKVAIDDAITPVLVQYNNLELLAPSRMAELMTDVSDKTHLKVVTIQIKSIDLIVGKAELLISYRNKPSDAVEMNEKSPT